MIATFTKYRHVFAIGLQSALVYRWNFLVRAGFSLLHLVAVMLLWGAVYRQRELVGGYSFAQTMSYFLGVLICNYLISAFNEDFQIGEEIRSGTINQFLTKPIDYFAYRLTLFTASRLITGAIIILPLALSLPWLLEYWPAGIDSWRFVAAVPALLLAAVIQFSIAYCFGLLAFWFLEIQGFVILSLAIETLLSGQVFPLDLLPQPLFQASHWLPFYYQMYFPVAIVTGRVGFDAVATGLAIQLGWCVVLVGGGRVLWQFGLRRHTAVGG